MKEYYILFIFSIFLIFILSQPNIEHVCPTNLDNNDQEQNK